MLPLLVITVFLSAALMFTLQPLVARLLLPVLGGSPAVWNTCMVFFQTVLLAGYAYAHLVGGWKRPRLAAAVHVGVLAAAFAALPVALPAWASDPPRVGGQVWWTLLALAAIAGLPMFAVSTTAPLAQRLLASTRHAAAERPYFLYAASNAGSLLALLSYPALIEPGLGLRAQGWAWTAAFGVFVACVIGGIALANRAGFRAAEAARNGRAVALARGAGRQSAPGAGAGRWPQRIAWLVLAAVPSSLLLGVTGYLSTDVAAIPLLWVLPLAVYLATFIVAFSERARAGIGPRLTTLMLPVVALSVALTARVGYPLGVVIGQQLLLLLVGAMACHVALARRAPEPARLTEFYLFVSLGGVLGGVFNALVAPVVFDSVVEYPAAVVAACLAARLGVEGRPVGLGAKAWRNAGAGVLVGAAVAGAAVGVRAALEAALVLDGRAMRLLAFAPGLVVAMTVCRARPVWFALVLAALFAVAWNEPLRGDEGGGRRLHAARTFFGVHRVNESPSGRFRTLSHGTTVHGLQFVTDDLRALPTMYYHPTGPIGHVFASLALDAGVPRRVAVVGLGAGALAAYCRAEYAVASMDFYEIDPEVVRIAQDPSLFTYIRDAESRGAAVRFVLGDGRLELARAADRTYDLIVLDAFSSDAIPVHLLTREALAVYRARLAPRGVVAVHISNRHIDLVPVIDALARAGSPPMAARFATDPTPPDGLRHQGKVGSQWAVLASDAADLRPIESTPGMFWGVPDRRLGARAWTDDWADVISHMRVWK